MNQSFEQKMLKKIKMVVFLLFCSLFLTCMFAGLWIYESSKAPALDDYKNAVRFRVGEQIDRAMAQRWGGKYDTELSNNNTVSISFDFADFGRTISNYANVIDQQTDVQADQVLVKLIRYDNNIGLPQYGGHANRTNRVSVAFWPYSSQLGRVVDDGTDISRPLNLGDLHP